MTIQILGVLAPADGSESKPYKDDFNPGFLRQHAEALERCGYDRVLIPQNARSPDPLIMASYVGSYTERLKMMVAHRPGFIAPTMAARMFATLNQFCGDRASPHIITAANDIETRNDGDFTTKEERYRRSREYVQVMRKAWTSEEPFDHQGEFYRFERAFSEIKPGKTTPVFWGGATGLGQEFGAEVADVYAMGSGTVERTKGLIDQVKALAKPHGRTLDFLLSIRLIVADTEEGAWKKAHDILDKVSAWQAQHGVIGRDLGEYQERRLREALAFKEGPDKHLWTGLTEATQGRRAIMCLVGSHDQVADALLGYHAVGINQFIVSGFDPIPDTIEIGETIIPRLRAAEKKASVAAE